MSAGWVLPVTTSSLAPGFVVPIPVSLPAEKMFESPSWVDATQRGIKLGVPLPLTWARTGSAAAKASAPTAIITGVLTMRGLLCEVGNPDRTENKPAPRQFG